MKEYLQLFFVFFCCFWAAISRAQAPDLILTRGKIFTSDTGRLYAEALAIKGDRIVAVGTTAAIEKQAGKGTRRINLEGRTVIPGINDAHDHIGYGTPFGRFIPFSEPMLPGPSLQQVLDSLSVAVKQVPKGTLIQGHLGLRLLEDSSARRAALDKITPDHPVILNAPWGHGTLLNTKAMEMLGIAETAPNPVGGTYERISGTQKISGLLSEYAEFDIKRKWYSTLPVDVLAQAFRQYSKDALRMGITSVQNMATSLSLDKTVSVIKAARLPIRVRVIRFPGSGVGGRELEQWSQQYSSSPLLEVSGMKWILDGTPLERGAFMRTGYGDKQGWQGQLNFPPDTVRKMLQEGFSGKEQLLLHIVGDSTPNLVINEMLKMAGAGNWKGKRVRFEHADGLLQDQWVRAKSLGSVAVVNPTHFSFAEINHARLGERGKEYQPLKSLLQAGIPVAIGSDGPNNPFLNIMLAAIHPTNPKEAITREQAVIAYTAGSAYAEFKEKEKGRLMPGMLADLAVLSQNIFEIPLEALPGTESVLTIVGGKISYDAGVLKK